MGCGAVKNHSAAMIYDKEVAEICLECPHSDCIGYRPNGCDRFQARWKELTAKKSKYKGRKKKVNR